MIDRARANARASAAPVRFETGGFGELAAALDDFAACLRPGGLLLIQNRNFDAVPARRERWMEPQAHREGETERC